MAEKLETIYNNCGMYAGGREWGSSFVCHKILKKLYHITSGKTKEIEKKKFECMILLSDETLRDGKGNVDLTSWAMVG